MTAEPEADLVLAASPIFFKPQTGMSVLRSTPVFLENVERPLSLGLVIDHW